MDQDTLKVDTKTLRSKLLDLKSAVDTRATTAEGHIKLTAARDGIKLAASDGQTFKSVTLSHTPSERSYAALLPYSFLAKLVPRLGTTVSFRFQKNGVVLQSGKYRAEIETPAAAEFPETPDVTTRGWHIVNLPTLKKLVQRSTGILADCEYVQLSCDGKNMSLLLTDGMRLLHISEPHDGVFQFAPSRFALSLLKTIRGEVVRIAATKAHIFFGGETDCIISSLSVKSPDLTPIISNPPPCILTVDIKDFLDAVKRATVQNSKASLILSNGKLAIETKFRKRMTSEEINVVGNGAFRCTLSLPFLEEFLDQATTFEDKIGVVNHRVFELRAGSNLRYLLAPCDNQ